MGYHTLSGRLSTDPYFDPRSLRAGYHDWHEISVDFEDCEPMRNMALTFSYRAFVAYSDAGDRRVDRVEMLKQQSTDELRRGVPRLSYALNPYSAAEAGIIAVLIADVATKASAAAIEDEVQRHQADRDEDLADRMRAGL